MDVYFSELGLFLNYLSLRRPFNQAITATPIISISRCPISSTPLTLSSTSGILQPMPLPDDIPIAPEKLRREEAVEGIMRLREPRRAIQHPSAPQQSPSQQRLQPLDPDDPRLLYPPTSGVSTPAVPFAPNPYTKSELGKLCRVSSGYMTLIFTAQRAPSLPMAVRMCRHLGITVDQLVRYLEETNEVRYS